MRSSAEPRIDYQGIARVAADEEAREARVVNLSVGGAFVEVAAPATPGTEVDLELPLPDGAAPVRARGQVRWTTEPPSPGAPTGVGLRFLHVGPTDLGRIARLVQMRTREPTGSLRRKVRLRLPELTSPLRTIARDLTEEGAMLEADLPWLRLGAPVSMELSPRVVRDGQLSWLGIDVAPDGAARLRLAVRYAPRAPVAEDLVESAFFADTTSRSGAAAAVDAKAGDYESIMVERPAKPRRFALVLAAALGCALGASAPRVLARYPIPSWLRVLRWPLPAGLIADAPEPAPPLVVTGSPQRVIPPVSPP
jgi:uncharacterized protein (TIGR02266 family)